MAVAAIVLAAVLALPSAGYADDPGAAGAAPSGPASSAVATPSPQVPVAARVTIPRVVGVSGRTAVALLRGAGFKVVLTPAVHSQAGNRRIAKQDLIPGRVTYPGARIRLAVSLGPAPQFAWRTAVASTFGGEGETQSVAGPYPNTGYMNAHGPYYFASKTMPFGTKVAFNYNGRTVIAVVADRGPYVGGREFDLGANLAAKLGFDLGTIRWAYVR